MSLPPVDVYHGKAKSGSLDTLLDLAQFYKETGSPYNQSSTDCESVGVPLVTGIGKAPKRRLDLTMERMATGPSFNGRTPALQAGNRGSIPRGSTLSGLV